MTESLFDLQKVCCSARISEGGGREENPQEAARVPHQVAEIVRRGFVLAPNVRRSETPKQIPAISTSSGGTNDRSRKPHPGKYRQSQSPRIEFMRARTGGNTATGSGQMPVSLEERPVVHGWPQETITGQQNHSARTSTSGR